MYKVSLQPALSEQAGWQMLFFTEAHHIQNYPWLALTHNVVLLLFNMKYHIKKFSLSSKHQNVKYKNLCIWGNRML